MSQKKLEEKIKDRDEVQKKMNLILGTLFLIAAGVILFKTGFLSDTSIVNSQSVEEYKYRDKKFKDNVNKHLQLKSIEMEIQDKKAELELKNTKELDLQGDLREVKIYDKRNTLEMPDVSSEENIARILGRTSPETVDPSTLNGWVQEELADREQFQQYTEEYKKEYARQFVENARKAGWSIKLDSQYRVLSVTPIRKNRNENILIEGSGSTAR